jgi:YgiT-type zinc finger domain-containing protein
MSDSNMKQKQQKKTQKGRENPQSRPSPQCKYCGCETNEDVIRAALWTNNGLIVIEDIPTRLCEGCGEQFFNEEVTQKIQQATTYPIVKAKRQIRVPVYSLLQVESEKRRRHSEPIRVDQDREEIFLCKYCESETVEGLVKSAFWVDGAWVAIENIQARVCQQCRQQFYDDKTIENISELNKRRFVAGTKRRDLLVPVFSLADIKESAC